MDEIVEEIAARLHEAAIVLDLDGTLAPIVVDPASARPLPELFAPLTALAARARVVAIVTGRPSSFVREVLDVPALDILGTYGLEGSQPIDPAVLAELRALTDTTPGTLLEDKGATVSVHVRRAAPADADRIRTAVESIGTDAGLAVFEGKQVIELAPPGPRKARAVRSVLERTSPAAAMYAGDDLEDIGGFDALSIVAAKGGPTLRVAVTGSETPGELLDAADLLVEGPAGLRDLLVRMLGDGGGGDVDIA
jgi:trehalose 6-phosphate phosphatase